MCVGIVALMLAAGGALAHESPTGSATIVQRDSGHYTLTLNFDVADALRRTAQPAMAAAEFQAAFSAMGTDEFAAAWARATAAWARGCQLEVGGRPLPALRWRWPLPQEAQARVRERLMHDLTGADRARPLTTDHAPHALVQAQAEFRVGGASAPAPRLLLHPAMRPLSVTSYRPNPQWVGPGEGAIVLKF